MDLSSEVKPSYLILHRRKTEIQSVGVTHPRLVSKWETAGTRHRVFESQPGVLCSLCSLVEGTYNLHECSLCAKRVLYLGLLIPSLPVYWPDDLLGSPPVLTVYCLIPLGLRASTFLFLHLGHSSWCSRLDSPCLLHSKLLICLQSYTQKHSEITWIIARLLFWDGCCLRKGCVYLLGSVLFPQGLELWKTL